MRSLFALPKDRIYCLAQEIPMAGGIREGDVDVAEASSGFLAFCCCCCSPPNIFFSLAGLLLLWNRTKYHHECKRWRLLIESGPFVLR